MPLILAGRDKPAATLVRVYGRVFQYFHGCEAPIDRIFVVYHRGGVYPRPFPDREKCL